MAETIIEIKNLHKYFGKNKVLKGIDLDIKKGEVVVIIGPSGSGKSTFLRSMNLLETPTKGVISFEGVDITDKSNDIFKMREKMGMVFQQFNLFPNMTVLENITFAPVKLKVSDPKEAESYAHELLRQVGLDDKADAYPQSLSGGQQQRVAIGRALITRPSLILADEPTGALDQTTGHEIMSILMRTARQTGAAVVVVTHDSNVAAFCDATVTMRDGRLSSPQQSQPTAGGAR